MVNKVISVSNELDTTVLDFFSGTEVKIRLYPVGINSEVAKRCWKSHDKIIRSQKIRRNSL